nr:hypothetical protein GCM10020092_030900 [Actinoplanes digitatis]
MSETPRDHHHRALGPGGDDPRQRRVRLRDERLPLGAGAGDGAEVDHAEHAQRQQVPRVRRQRLRVAVHAAERSGRRDRGSRPDRDGAPQRLGQRARHRPVRLIVLVLPHHAAELRQVRADAVRLLQRRGDRRALIVDALVVPDRVVAGAEGEPAVRGAGGVVRGAHGEPADRAEGRLPPQRGCALRVEVLPAQGWRRLPR